MRFQPARWMPAVASASPGVNESNFPFRLQAMRWLGRQNWIPKGQDWMLRKLWHPDSGRLYAFNVDFFGRRYPGNLAQYIDWAVFVYGCYSYCELSLLEELAREIRSRRGKVVFMDAGANVGHHTLFMADKADKIFAFEPFPPLQALIQQKIAVNQLSHVQIVPCALGEQEGVLSYYPGGGSNSGTGTFIPENEGTYQSPVEISIRRGDEALDRMNAGCIDLLKVDVEGFEPFVFRGLKKHIFEDRPAILTEITERSRSSFGSEDEFRKCFWDGAIYYEVHGRRPRERFKLKPLVYETASEILILPPEMADFGKRLLEASAKYN